MFENLMRLYVMGLMFDVRSPMPHLVGPPGSGKSSMVQELADLLGVRLHIINVSRLSPLEVEGVQMPHGRDDQMVLRMLPATFWTSLEEGDILLMDEFLRGFPEVFNGLLDIFTSRRAGAYHLPKVFIIGASNSVTTYDAALEDRLVHMPVPDPRRSTTELKRLAKIIADAIGLLPEMADSDEMSNLLRTHVLPTYEVLDLFQKTGSKVVANNKMKGLSVRHLIGLAQLRINTVPELNELLTMNNMIAMQKGKEQYVVLMTTKGVPAKYEQAAEQLRGNPRLTELQALNLEANLQLIETERLRTEGEQQ